jgi:hypothetical protein
METDHCGHSRRAAGYARGIQHGFSTISLSYLFVKFQFLSCGSSRDRI